MLHIISLFLNAKHLTWHNSEPVRKEKHQAKFMQQKRKATNMAGKHENDDGDGLTLSAPHI